MFNWLDALNARATTQKDVGWSWVVCIVSIFFNFFVNGFSLTIGLLYTHLLDEFGESRAKTALVATILHSVTFLSSPLACFIIKYLGPRKTALVASLVLPLTFIVSSMSSSLDVLYVSLGLSYGFGACLVTNLVYIVVFFYFEKRASIACGLIAAGVPLGPIILTKPFKYVLETHGWRFLLRILSIPLFFVTFVGAIVFVSKLNDRYTGMKKSTLHQCKVLFRMPAFNIWLVGIFLARLGADIMSIHQTQFCIEFGIPWEKAAMLPLYMGIGNTIGRLGLGQLLHIRLVHPISTYQIIMVLGGVTALVSALSSTYTHIVIFSILYMAFDGSIQGLDAVVVSIISGQGTFVDAYGITLLTEGISRLIGPPSLGFIVDKTSDYTILFYTVGLPLITGAFALLFLRCIKSGPFHPKDKPYFESEVDSGDLYSIYEKTDVLIERLTSL